MRLNIRIAGAAGQGLATAGSLVTQILAGLNVHVFTCQSYMSRIRGGLNWFDITVSDSKIYAPSETSDILIALSEAGLDVLKQHNTNEKTIFVNSQQELKEISGNFNVLDFAKEAENKFKISTYSGGLVIGLLGLDFKTFKTELEGIYPEKEKDIKAAINGYEEGVKLSDENKLDFQKSTPNHIMKGSEAIGLSAATSGVKFVSSYPMTPGSATFTHLAKLSDKYSIVVEQAEDEIAAVNMINGSVYAGVPAIACTSGGGFSLMCEGVSLAGMTENPISIMVAQRPGPATGLPTRTAQEDLKLAVNIGHGDFPIAVYAPGTVEECISLTREALDKAHKYQTPTIILTDQYLQDHIENIETPDDKYNPINRHITEKSDQNYKRYEENESGISPRAIPGSEACVVVDSDEHNEYGHLTEDLEISCKQKEKRMKKLDGMIKEAKDPFIYGEDDADEIFICWGSTYGPCRETVDELNNKGRKSKLIYFSQVFPLDSEKLRNLIDQKKRLYVVEGNYTGQFASILKEHDIISDYELIPRYDGLPFTKEYILREVT